MIVDEPNLLHEELAELDKIITRQEAFIVSLKIRKQALTRQLGIKAEASGRGASIGRRLKLREDLKSVAHDRAVANAHGTMRNLTL
ncbi:MAG: hypothetical protein ACREQE_03980 [Candidatus Binataceae bacterium]